MKLKLLKRRWRQGIGMRMQRRGVVPYTNQQQIATVTVASRSSHERASRFGKSEIRILHSSLAKASSANSAFSLTSAMSYRPSTPSRMGYGINRVSSNNILSLGSGYGRGKRIELNEHDTLDEQPEN